MPKRRVKKKRKRSRDTENANIRLNSFHQSTSDGEDGQPLFFIDKKRAKDNLEPITESNTSLSTDNSTKPVINPSWQSQVIAQDDENEIVIGEEDEDERRLEQLVFGGDPEALLAERSDDDEGELNQIEEKDTATAILPFEISTKPGIMGDSINDSEADFEIEEEIALTKFQIPKEKKPAWLDEDDEKLSIDVKNEKRLRKLRMSKDEASISGTKFEQRLRSQFEKLVGDPEWAQLDRRGTESDDDDEEFMKTSRSYLGKSERLPKSIIEISRVKDANIAKRSAAGVQCIEFHPSAKVILTAGLNKTLDLFQVDGERNPKLQTVFLDGFPIYSAHFTPDGEQVVLSSRRKHFYIYDMIAGQVIKVPRIKGKEEKSLENFSISPDGNLLAFLGNSGYINLVSTKTRQWVSSLKMNGSVKSIAFTADGSRLFSAGTDGEVYIWDLRTKRCQHKYRDEGCLKGTSLAVSGDGQYIACGTALSRQTKDIGKSSSGVVNIYDDQCLVRQHPKPLKAIMNMTTCVNVAKFNPASEILALSSRNIKDSLKLVHLPSLTAFSNWPTQRTPLGYLQCLDFSPKAGYLALGNDKGKALLYRLSHYPDA